MSQIPPPKAEWGYWMLTTRGHVEEYLDVNLRKRKDESPCFNQLSTWNGEQPNIDLNLNTFEAALILNIGNTPNVDWPSLKLMFTYPCPRD